MCCLFYTGTGIHYNIKATTLASLVMNLELSQEQAALLASILNQICGKSPSSISQGPRLPGDRGFHTPGRRSTLTSDLESDYSLSKKFSPDVLPSKRKKNTCSTEAQKFSNVGILANTSSC